MAQGRSGTGDVDRPGARTRFLETGASTGVRSVVAESWVRSSAAGVDPDQHLAPVVLDGSSLVDYRSAHPLSAVFPLLYDVLGRAAVDCDCVMAVGDAEGKLLWVRNSATSKPMPPAPMIATVAPTGALSRSTSR